MAIRLMVAPHGGAWIEIALSWKGFNITMSPLTEGRGLKCKKVSYYGALVESPLTEGRGLKYGDALPSRRNNCRPSRRGVD